MPSAGAASGSAAGESGTGGWSGDFERGWGPRRGERGRATWLLQCCTLLACCPDAQRSPFAANRRSQVAARAQPPRDSRRLSPFAPSTASSLSCTATALEATLCTARSTPSRHTDEMATETKKYTWDDLRTDEAKSKDGLLMLINGKVYAISKFLDEVRLCSHSRALEPRADLSRRIHAGSTRAATRFSSAKQGGTPPRRSKMWATRTRPAKSSPSTTLVRAPT